MSYGDGMAEVPLRELSNHTSEVLRRVEAGERLTVTVSGRPVAELVPLQRRRPYLTATEWYEMRDRGELADRGLLDDLREMMPDTDEDFEDPWERAERRAGEAKQ